MRIEVVVSGWEQHCCGPAFVRGDTATVSILAADPAQVEAHEPARFIEEHHGQTPSDVPKQDVTGTVARITGVSYEMHRRPGPVPVFDVGTTLAASRELDRVGARETEGFGELHLLLDLADDVELPLYVVIAESRAAADRAEFDKNRADRMREDDVGIILATIAQEIVKEHSSFATIDAADDGLAVSVQPRRANTASISWARSSSRGSDVIAVKLGEGQFALPADVEHASDLRHLIAAAAAGRVHERVHQEDDATRLETMARSADGRVWTAEIEEAPFRAGGGVVMMSGRLASRLRDGDHGYEPWTA